MAAMRAERKHTSGTRARRDDPLIVRSVDKAFRVLNAFDSDHPTMGLTQIAAAIGLDKSAAQRFTHTLESLGYLRKDPETRRYELTVKTLAVGSAFLRSSHLVRQASPYLSHLSQLTDETVNLAVLDGTEVVYLSRFVSRHVFKTDIVIGSRLPAFCTAAGIAMLSRLPLEEARAVLEASQLRPFTPHTTWQTKDLLRKISRAARRGYATTFEEVYRDDLSIGAAVVDAGGAPRGAITLAVSKARYTPAEAEARFSSMVVAAAGAVKI